MNIKKVLLGGWLSCFVLASAYAINLPSSSSQHPTTYGGGEFVSKPEKAPEAVKQETHEANQPSEAEPISPSKQTSQNVVTSIQVAANTPATNTMTQVAVKAHSNCPVACPQKNGIVVKKEIIQKITNRQISSANANEIEQLLGPACSCFTFNPLSADVWTCQWKGDLSSNRLENTINITFEGGMLANVTAVRGDGVTYMALPNANITVYQPQ